MPSGMHYNPLITIWLRWLEAWAACRGPCMCARDGRVTGPRITFAMVGTIVASRARLVRRSTRHPDGYAQLYLLSSVSWVGRLGYGPARARACPCALSAVIDTVPAPGLQVDQVRIKQSAQKKNDCLRTPHILYFRELGLLDVVTQSRTLARGSSASSTLTQYRVLAARDPCPHRARRYEGSCLSHCWWRSAAIA